MGRRRTGGKRSRTGCRTCRARHVKCDETPGACRNCTSTGRRCEGYDLHRLPLQGGRGKKASTIQVQALIRNGFSWTMTSDERRCLSYFQYHTLPSLLGLFGSPLWEKLVFQVGQSEPAIFHAIVALSAIHQDSEARGMPMSMEEPDNSWHRFSLEQLSRAFNLLIKRRTSQDPRFCNVTLVCCLLFVLSDLLRGHYDDAFVHLQGGLAILQELKAHRQLVAPMPREELVEQSLVAAFAHLDIMSTHFGVGGPVLRIENELGDGQSECNPTMPFQTLQDALRAFEPNFSAIFRFISPCMYLPPEKIQSDYETLHVRQIYLWSRFNQFIRMFKQFYSTMYDQLSLTDQRGADLIQIWILGLSVSLKTCLYEMIVACTEAFLQKYPERPTISIQCGIIPAVFHAAFACRDYTIRWQAIELLWAWPHREGALKIELLALSQKGQDPHAPTPILTSRTSERLSVEEVLARINEHQRRVLLCERGDMGEEPFDDIDCSPLDLIETVKCMSGWSCVRAFQAHAARLDA
ncbi:hypothetical protein BDV23DRAFT_193080 [Aspergillus alliaceus]|uniref:Zn(2)-C6 fungal-type domain-containing protein n=1 Tax=Petromyces alliaceus TaxID=209559 RepID=A0A5N7CD05_PETAA|nr:hypothetical protein BDV23DRAFT_193080 [Aspergillus alliaceus]